VGQRSFGVTYGVDTALNKNLTILHLLSLADFMSQTYLFTYEKNMGKFLNDSNKVIYINYKL